MLKTNRQKWNFHICCIWFNPKYFVEWFSQNGDVHIFLPRTCRWILPTSLWMFLGFGAVTNLWSDTFWNHSFRRIICGLSWFVSRHAGPPLNTVRPILSHRSRWTCCRCRSPRWLCTCCLQWCGEHEEGPALERYQGWQEGLGPWAVLDFFVSGLSSNRS